MLGLGLDVIEAEQDLEKEIAASQVSELLSQQGPRYVNPRACNPSEPASIASLHTAGPYQAYVEISGLSERLLL